MHCNGEPKTAIDSLLGSLSDREIERRGGPKATTLWRLRTGRIRTLRTDTAAALARVLGVSPAVVEAAVAAMAAESEGR
jgi:hypothetical protein